MQLQHANHRCCWCVIDELSIVVLQRRYGQTFIFCRCKGTYCFGTEPRKKPHHHYTFHANQSDSCGVMTEAPVVWSLTAGGSGLWSSGRAVWRSGWSCRSWRHDWMLQKLHAGTDPAAHTHQSLWYSRLLLLVFIFCGQLLFWILLSIPGSVLGPKCCKDSSKIKRHWSWTLLTFRCWFVSCSRVETPSACWRT